MTWLDSPFTHFAETEIALRLGLASLFGAVVGFEREMRDRPAGLRTHMLISLAAAIFTILAFEIFYAVRSESPVANIDPLRLVEAVTAGVAFLAAGTILRSGGKVEGLTTGASMWLAGAFGMACGLGYYTIALIGGVFTIMILAIVLYLEDRYIDPGKTENDDAPANKD
jgi:putative Mg2+ transporter-C (MgtC) family protein